jgi:hypothetical protein
MTSRPASAGGLSGFPAIAGTAHTSDSASAIPNTRFILTIDRSP